MYIAALLSPEKDRRPRGAAFEDQEKTVKEQQPT
jgi:hypothetical protein